MQCGGEWIGLEAVDDLDAHPQRVFSRHFWGHCPAEINMADNKQIVFTFRNGSTRDFTGRSLLLTFSVPQFFFHHGL